MDTSKATARPWRATGDKTRGGNRIIVHARGEFGDEQVAYAADFNEYARDAEADANAALIVRAVNSHEALVEALRDMLERFTVNTPEGYSDPGGAISRARAALRIAEGGT